MARKKNKQREPYRKSSRMGKRGIAFLIPAILIGLLIIFLIILITNPEICLFGKGSCFRIVSLKLSRGFMFWLTFLSYFLVMAGILYIYWKIISYGMKYVHLFIAFLKKLTMNIEQYFLRLSV
jgi:hypothetical protein